MSVLVRIVAAADTDQFRAWVASDTETLLRVSDRAKGLGCTHHRFGIGDGEVFVVDEWENAEAFQGFFAHDEMGPVMQAAGITGAPDIAFYEAIETADEF